MPHLTGAGARYSASGARALGLGAPGYAHPLLAPVEWTALTRPGTPLHWAVLNVADGPGVRPDPHCLDAAGRLVNAGLRVLGHLDLAYGRRPLRDLVSDARRFLDWYRVGGFYLDRCPVGRAELPVVRRTTATLEALLDAGPGAGPGYDGGCLVLGHDTHPHPGYADTADQLVTFRGPWTDYRWSRAAEWTAGYPPERFVHLVHGVPRAQLDEAVRTARREGAGTIFFTDHAEQSRHNSPFETLPGFWDEIVSRVGTGVSE
jgi:hypothetical protein